MALTYEAIATTTLTSAQQTVTFSSIPQTYTDLRLVAKVRESSTNADARLRINGDTATTYNGTRMFANAGVVLVGLHNTTDGMWISQNSMTSLTWALIEIDFNSYTTTNNWKTILSKISNGSYASQVPQFFNFVWRNTSAVTSVSFFNTNTPWIIGSSFTIYGIKAA